MTPSLFSIVRTAGPASVVAERTAQDGQGAASAGGFAEQLQGQLQPPPQAAPRPGTPAPQAAPAHNPDAEDATTRQARRGTAPPRPRAATPPVPHRPEAESTQQAKASAATPASAEPEGGEDTPDATHPGARRGREAGASAEGSDTLNWMLHLAARPPGDAAGAAPTHGVETGLGRAGKNAGMGRAAAEAQGPAGAAGAGSPAAFGADLGAGLGTVAVEMERAHGATQALPAASAVATVEAAAAGLAAPSDLPPSAQVTLTTPVDRPEFRDELAAQISSFAHDGIQEAVLTLNPAEMGPITVQIVIDGTQATVDFQAAQPATRDLIEGSLPSLASALHGEGLTLSGGSVGEQHSGRQPQHAPDPGRAAAPEPGAAEPPLVVRATAQRHAGGLDLYA